MTAVGFSGSDCVVYTIYPPYGLAISPIVREYVTTAREEHSYRKGIFNMAKAFDANFYIEVLTGDLKTIAHPNPDISREVRRTAFENTRETLKTLAENGAGEFYRDLHEAVKDTDEGNMEFNFPILESLGHRILTRQMKLPKA